MISGAVEEVASGTRSSCGAGEDEQFLGVGRCSDTHLELATVACCGGRGGWGGWLMFECLICLKCLLIFFGIFTLVL